MLKVRPSPSEVHLRHVLATRLSTSGSCHVPGVSTAELEATFIEAVHSQISHLVRVSFVPKVARSERTRRQLRGLAAGGVAFDVDVESARATLLSMFSPPRSMELRN